MLPGHPPERVRPVHGRLDRLGERGRARRGAGHLRGGGEPDAVPLPALPARGSPHLGVPAAAAALAGAVGRRGDVHVQLLRPTLLLLLQVLQLLPAQRRGSGEERKRGGVRQPGHVV